MSDLVIVAAISALPATIGAVAAMRASSNATKAADKAAAAEQEAKAAKAAQLETKELVGVLQVQTDGHMANLLAKTEEVGRLAGAMNERLVSAERAALKADETAVIAADVAVQAVAAAEQRTPSGTSESIASALAPTNGELGHLTAETKRIADAAEAAGPVKPPATTP